MRLENKIALITASASGIGRAGAVLFAREGAAVAVADIDKGRIADTVAEIKAAGGRAHGIPCDLTKDADSRRIVREAVEAFGGLDIVVANAGVGAYGPFLELAPEHLDEMIDVNVKGTLYAVRAALPHLLRSEAADVVTLASEAGRRGLPFEAVYCASKFAQVGFTRALDHELREHGIRCTNVCPGGVATDFAMGRGRTPDMPALREMMTSEDVAEAVLFVLTRPRNHRILEMAFRPMSEESWG